MSDVYSIARAAWKAAMLKALREHEHAAVATARARYAYAAVMCRDDARRLEFARTALQRRLREARMNGHAKPAPVRYEESSEEQAKDSVAGRMLAAGQLSRHRAFCTG